MGLEGLDLVGSETTTGFISLGSDPQTNPNWYGSGFFKQDRACNNEDEYRSSKLAKNDELSGCKPLMFQQRNALLRSNSSLFFDEQEEQQMLSFSAPKSDAVSVDRNSKNLTFPHFHLTGYNSGGFDDANMHGGYKGPFTPCQWMELEHQALIYKYIISNVPIPSNLLIPIRKSLVSSDFSSFSGGLLRPNTSTGWRAFQLGFSNNTDPEPGRCRRTDGKKWRCSRDAVANHKYCERHMNRGRNRSRKPVEGQSSHSVATTATTTTKLMPSGVSSSSASVVGPVCGSNKPNSLTLARQQFENLQPGDASNLSAADPLNRLILNKGTVGENIPQNGHLKSKENPFLNPKQPLNPSHKSSSSIECRNFGSSHDLTSQESESQHSFRRFIDDWPKSLSNCSAISWPELDVQSYRTQLSISIPMAASDFMSTTSSPNTKNLTPPPLRLSREFNPIHIGLGVDNVTNESNQRQIDCTPVSWDTSMGGPLGEALHSSSSNIMDFKNSSVLNLMTEGSDYSPRIGSSPTGVLQKTTFSSLSNSSAGSSPRTENNKTREGFTHCNDILGSTHVES